MYRRASILLILAVALGCASPRSVPSEMAPIVETSVRGEPARTLAIAMRVEPNTLAFRPLRESGVTSYLSKRLFNAGIGQLDDKGALQPYLVESLPQLNTDAWRVFPDGRMETTYRFRPNLVWHDGMPLTSEDFAFSWQVYSSPELGLSGSSPMNAMEEVTATDDRTLVIRWRRPYPDASFLAAYQLEFPALPRHLLGRSFELGDADAFANHPYWAREYVGLGPYRVDRWEPGAVLEAVPFDQHVLGRAKIERLRLVFIGDGNTVLANLLAGEVQMAGDGALRLEQVATLRREWASRGGGDIVLQPTQWRAANFQLRPELATPPALLDARVRQALSHATDKAALNEALYGGAAIPADFVLPPLSAWGVAAERAVAKYPYDLRRSEQLMNEVGFAKGADGFFAGGGERFTSEAKTNAAPDNEAELSVIASLWRQAGFNFQEAVLPVAQAQDAQLRATFTGVYTNSTPALEGTLVSLNATNVPSAENRWRGSNRGGWVHHEFSRLVDAFTTTLDPAVRTQQVEQMARIFGEELPAVSLYFRAQAWAHAASLVGPRSLPPESNIGWNVHEWELR